MLTCQTLCQHTSLALCLISLGGCTPDVFPAVGPSCNELAETCGPRKHENCCARSFPIQGESFNGDNNADYPAIVSEFVLDRFEVTVGRFRKFLADYPANRPMADAGAHPRIAGSGWDPEWDTFLADDAATLSRSLQCGTFFTWTNTPGPNENKPLNCVTWYEAFAFCAWDGGRIPTSIEWSAAAVGGSEQRRFPWGDVAFDRGRAVYDCAADGSAAGDCTLGDILDVGSKSPRGDGRWGQADLAGSMAEWVLDWFDPAQPTPKPCEDCARITQGMATKRLIAGRSWNVGLDGFLGRGIFVPGGRDGGVGFRCARQP